MSEKKRQLIEYFMMFPVFIMIGFLVGAFLCYAGATDAYLFFFLCYFAINLLVTVICCLLKIRKWDIVISFAIIILLSIMFRDLVLIFNMLYAFGVTMIIYALRLKKLERFGLPAVTVILLLLWILCCPDITKSVAICLTSLTLISLSVLFDKKIVYYFAVPLCIALIVAFIPVKDEPYQWMFVKKSIEKTSHVFKTATDEIIYLFGDVGFDGGRTGYSNSGRIAGGLTDYHTEELLYDHGGRKTIIYLKGKSYTTLDKKGFTDPENDTHLNDWFALYINALYRHKINRREASFFSKINTAFVKYRYLRTTDTIIPATPLYIQYDGSDIPKHKKKNFQYQVRYLMIDYGSPYYLSIVNDPYYLDHEYYPALEEDTDLSSDSGENTDTSSASEEYADYDTIVDYTKQLYSIDLRLIMSREEYEAAIQSADLSRYLDTSMATDRIKSLTAEITAGLENDFEKARAIETYLRTYDYNKAVDLTESDNYVDTFLFETKEGYCVHYASAMVLMLRLSGIPSRYCVGYRHNEDKSESIISSDAHSWPEAYIEGYGWAPFEPTGAMETPEEYSWGLGSDYNREDYMKEEYPEDGIIPHQNDTDYYNNRYITDIPETEPVVQEKKIDKAFIVKFAGYCGVLLGALLLTLLIIILIRYIRYTLLTPEKKLRQNVLKILDLMETPEKADALKELDDETKKEELSALLDIYNRVRFRGDPADEETVRRAQIMYRFLRKI